jgi:molecular chaperone HscB
MRAAHFCRQCGKVQPPAPVDYFTFFGLPYKLNLDLAQLEREFYSLSRHLHPDINAVRSTQEQAWSLEQSSSLNDAYRTLKDPIARTEYLLRLQGVHMEEQSTAATEEARRTGRTKKQVVPADLLEEVFDLNMQLEEMRASLKMGEDDPALRGDLERAQAQFKEMMADVDEDLRRAWAAWDAALEANDPAAKEKQKEAMVALLDRRSYLRNLLREVGAVLSPETAGVAKANL